MIDPTCDHCGDKLEEGGALVFTPPLFTPPLPVSMSGEGVPHTAVGKYHLCVRCFTNVFLPLLKPPREPQGMAHDASVLRTVAALCQQLAEGKDYAERSLKLPEVPEELRRIAGTLDQAARFAALWEDPPEGKTLDELPSVDVSPEEVEEFLRDLRE